MNHMLHRTFTTIVIRKCRYWIHTSLNICQIVINLYSKNVKFLPLIYIPNIK